MPWYSSGDGDFNYDFHVSFDATRAPAEHNFRSAEELRARGQAWILEGDQPGVSVFLRDGDAVFHSYSAYARGVEGLTSTTGLLDVTPLGRQGL